MPPEANALESAIDAMVNAGNTEPEINETQQTSDAGEASKEDGAGTQTEGNTAVKPDASTQSGTDSAANAGGEASTGRSRPQIYAHHLPSDKHGNLIDNQGNVVARAGNERAYYEAARNAMRRIQEADAEFARYDAELSAYRQAATAPEKFKLKPTEAVAAMEWAALYKSDPAAAVKELLADAAARGIDISGLGIETAALEKIIDNKIKPFTQDREAQQRDAEALAAGQREWNALVEDFDWLPRHEQAFATLLSQHPNMTPHQIALRIEREARARGIDLHNPAPQEQRVNRATMPAMTNGGNMTPQSPMREAPVAANNTRDRIRALMRQHNFSMER